MPDILIRGLDDATVAHLRAQAKLHGRSLAAEIREVLSRERQLSKAEFLSLARGLQAGQGTVPQTPAWVLIREDRDSH